MMNSRRNFIRNCSLSTIPFFTPSLLCQSSIDPQTIAEDQLPLVNFVSDGLLLSPTELLEQWQFIQEQNGLARDYYGMGGAVTKLEKTFAKLTGKEQALFLPTGTMANQVAIKLLNGVNTKVLVPENSHIFRDEADAAQSVHHLRLVPVGKGKAYFTAKDLKDTITYYEREEVFRSGLGTVAIESPIRRANGVAVPLIELRAISDYCRSQGYKMHLDGARLHMASVYQNTAIQTYAAFFDTVYISLYKYLHAPGGAVLCGDSELIERARHYLKILGGTTYQNWPIASIALHQLDGLEARWEEVKQRAAQLFEQINQLDGVKVTPIPEGTNVFNLRLDERIDWQKLRVILRKEHRILLREPEGEGLIPTVVNESIMRRSPEAILEAWKTALLKVRS